MNNNLPQWDLSDLYPNQYSQEIKSDISLLEKSIKDFKNKFYKKIASCSGNFLLKSIQDYEKINQISGRLISFAYLQYAKNLSESKNISFYQDISEKINQLTTNLVFYEIELNQISDENLQKLFGESEKLKFYQPFLRDVRAFRKHNLCEEIEKLFLEKSSTSRNSWIRLFDETMADLKFPYEKKQLSCAEIFDLLSDKDEKIRAKASDSIGNTLKENSKIFAFITNVLAKDKSITDNWRSYKSPISSRNLSNFIEDEVVENLLTSVKENYPKISHRYYKIKAKILGKKKLTNHDRNAPLLTSEKNIPWSKAVELVLKSYGEFSPKLRQLGQKFFDNSWIDAKVTKGKDSGAFAHPTVTNAHPYLMLNYQGKVRDVMTLAHELGHGVHQYLARKQGDLMAGTPLTLAETASVFGEQLTFQNILKTADNQQEKKIIICNKIEDMLNTAVRQVAFLEFEKKIHHERQKGEIPLEKICQFWIEVQKESLGDIFEFDENYKYYWSYIPHFIHSPFYVYSYAFGECLVNSLYATYKNGLPNFEEKYFTMLEAGGTLHHKDLLDPFNIDISKKEFWQKGLDVISGYIDMVESK
jgi:oligoendopeptidase F